MFGTEVGDSSLRLTLALVLGQRGMVVRIEELVSGQELNDHGPLTRYVKLRVAHAPGMPGTFSPPPTG